MASFAVTLSLALLCLSPARGQSVKKLSQDRVHRLILFPSTPGTRELEELRNRGARVLQHVPENGWMISAPADMNLEGLGLAVPELMTPEQKWSRALQPVGSPVGILEDSGGSRFFLVEFFPDVEAPEGREIVLREGLRIREHPNLLDWHLVVEGSLEQARGLILWDEVAYVFPASEDLVQGKAVRACIGAVSIHGIVGHYISKVGEGWDGPGKGSADLGYSIGGITNKVAQDAGLEEIRRALAEWSRYVRVDFQPRGSAGDPRNLHILWASRSHGDPFPFDGAGRVLAHTFYPSAPNSEPIAGDLHLDADEDWRIGQDIDIYSVVLHELGHALGLGHSDKPGAVMYGYYRRATELMEEDISAVRELYAARETNGGTPTTPPPAPPTAPPQAPPPPPTPNPEFDTTPPTIRITSPSGSSVLTSAPAITLRGTANDNIGVRQVIWNSNTMPGAVAQGTAEWTAQVPLLVGYNYVTVRAIDAAGNGGWRTIVVRRM